MKKTRIMSDDTTSATARRPRVLLGASGSVAAVKLPALALQLSEFADVRLVLTKSADFFLAQAEVYDPKSWEQFARRTRAFGAVGAGEDDERVIESIRDEHEWDAWRVVGDRVLHIEVAFVHVRSFSSRVTHSRTCEPNQLKDWADVLVAAPLSANSLAKIANGLSDNLLVRRCD